MWFFNSPQIIFGESSLTYLANLQGRKAAIISDANLNRLGYVQRIIEALKPTGMQVKVFDAVETDPSLQTVRVGSGFLITFEPDWIIALGGGSVIDAAKAMWILYECPGYLPEAINPVERLGLRKKANFAAIPTTTGTGSEATWAVVLTDTGSQRKLSLGNREAMPDLAILDPELISQLPKRLTADTGMDALTHAIEGFTNTWHNDFSDGLCLKAAELIFEHLPTACRQPENIAARSGLQNAAAIAGLGFGNANAALAHAMGHSLGAVFHVPHGRAVSVFLPYTIEYCANEVSGGTRYAPLAHFLNLPSSNEAEAAASLVIALRALSEEIGLPLKLGHMDISRADFDQHFDLLVDNALNDATCVTSSRIPGTEELRRLFMVSYEGLPVDF
jgi:alcohol dehydrogenase class IV